LPGYPQSYVDNYGAILPIFVSRETFRRQGGGKMVNICFTWNKRTI